MFLIYSPHLLLYFSSIKRLSTAFPAKNRTNILLSSLQITPFSTIP